MEVLVGLISGAIGGNVAGRMLARLDQGILFNSISGLLGGGLGTTILYGLSPEASGGGLDVDGLVSQVAGGGIGGVALMAVGGAIRNMMAK